MQRYIFLLIFLALIVPSISSAGIIELNLDYPRFGNIELDCNKITDKEKDEGIQCGQNLTSLIAWLYFFIVTISGLAAFVMIVWGGVQYLTSAGDPAKTGDAKDRMQKALLGLLIILASWLILQTINPELTVLREPGTSGEGSGLITAPCIILQDGNTCNSKKDIGFTVNGKQHAFIKPDELFRLDWNMFGSNCVPSNSADVDAWAVNKINVSGEMLNLKILITSDPDPSTYTFIITCHQPKELTRTVTLTVSSTEPEDEPEGGFSVILKIDEEDKIKWTGSKPVFSWNEYSGFVSGDSCTLTGPAGLFLNKKIISGEESGEEWKADSLNPQLPENIYTINCVSTKTTGSAEGTAIITVE